MLDVHYIQAICQYQYLSNVHIFSGFIVLVIAKNYCKATPTGYESHRNHSFRSFINLHEPINYEIMNGGLTAILGRLKNIVSYV